MKKIFIDNFLLILVLFCGFFFDLKVYAYIPPSQFIIKTLAGKHSGPKIVKIRSLVETGVGSGAERMDGETATPSSLRFKDVTFVDFQKRVLQSRAWSEDGQELFSREQNFLDSKKALSVAMQLLFETNADFLSKNLWELGIPIRTESELLRLSTEEERIKFETSWLGRFKGKIAWVIGARGSELSTPPQLWIEKDQFLPLRIFLKQKESTFEIRFENFRFYKEWPFPQTIFLLKWEGSTETLWLKSELQELVVNPDAKETVTLTQTPSGLTSAGKAAPAELQELIQYFYHWFR